MNVISWLFLFVIFASVAYMEGPIPIKGDSKAAAIKFNALQDATDAPVLEMRLIDTKQVDGNLVETYREFEVLKDAEGNVIESTPTENYEYISYELDQKE